MSKLIFLTLLIASMSVKFLSNGCPIYLTIALNGKTFEDSNLEINWGPNCYEKPGWIGIFLEDPSISIRHPIYRFTDVFNTSGTIRTDIKVGNLTFPKGWIRNNKENITSVLPKIPYSGKQQCLKYFLASFKGTELLCVECLKIQPNWMFNIDSISNLKLKDLFLPGTHASGAYQPPNGLRMLIHMEEYLATQHFNVLYQLIFGIRYLDFSVGFTFTEGIISPYANDFFITNEHKLINPVRTILKDVRHFVEASHEVVVLDFSSFPIGFYKHSDRHSNLVHLIYDELKDLIYEQEKNINIRKPCYDLTLNDIIKTNRYIIVLYPIEELPYPDKESPLLCQTWKKFSTSFMNISQALDLMQALYSKKNASLTQNEGWVFNAITSFEHALNENLFLTAKQRAEGINQKVVGWLKGPWGMNANVVTLDYFSSTNVVDVAISVNVQKAFKAKNKNYVNFELDA